jgi:hypothetical protein
MDFGGGDKMLWFGSVPLNSCVGNLISNAIDLKGGGFKR